MKKLKTPPLPSQSTVPSPGARIEVRWLDAASGHRWRTPEEADLCPVSCKSVGYLIRLTDTYITFTQTVQLVDPTSENPEKYANIWTIPLGCVTNVEVV